MQTDFARALARILVYEGGKVNNPNDPGGRTNKGITQATYDAYLREHDLPSKDVYTIPNTDLATIYKTRYWNVIHGDDLPVGLDLVVFDAAVNSGPAQAGKWLQRALGEHFTGTVDGLIGPKTLQAIEDYGSLEDLVREVCERRLGTLKQNPHWKEFGNGWSARIANVLKTADAWLGAADEPPAADVTGAGGHRKAPVSDIKNSTVSTVAAHATTIATTAGAVATNVSTNLAPVQQALPNLKWLGILMGGLAAGAAIATFVVKTINDLKIEAAKGLASAQVDLDADAKFPQVSITPPKAG